MPPPLVILEKWNSRQATVALDATESRTQLLFVVIGTDDDYTVRVVVEATLPLVYSYLWLLSYDIEYVGDLVWDVKATYSIRPPRRPGDITQPDANGNVYTLSFDTTGATARARQALEHIATYSAAGEITPAPEWKGVIGWNGQQAEGTEITVPQFTFRETHYFTLAQITGIYKRNLFHLTGRVNNAPFRGFAKGEVLFLGAQGSRRGLDNWEITFTFACSPNLESTAEEPVYIGDVELKKKEGWHHVWVSYKKVDSNSRVVPRPQYVMVERVYKYGDFSLLGIGTF